MLVLFVDFFVMDFIYWLTNQFSEAGTQEYVSWYSALKKPFFAPPTWLFGVAWGIIYPMIIIAFVWACVLLKKKKVDAVFVWMFVANIVSNLLFTAVSLAFKNNWLSLLNILVVLGTLIWIELHAWKKAKPVFWLLVPYMLWGSFATVLQLAVAVMN
jgi:tryptophan-rich sensory protein